MSSATTELDGQLVLVADDDPVNQRIVTALLAHHGLRTITASHGDAVLPTAVEANPDVILLDVMMPGRDGLDVCRALKRDVRTTGIPVIFLTGRTEEADVLAGFAAGAVDYVAKPFRAAELVARTRAHAHLHRLRGLLTVCSHCHRIRKDDASWERLDRYVARRTDAAFSHGLCEECVQQHYG